uniref:Chaperone protein DnaK, Chaperone protein DnaJ 2 fusion n=1 Tax=Thermus thermophilus (strain ATCC 27634 / DSM 579 / HB8) TaxID=300852 RepID=UPI00122C1302|nr:Chain A, Chaperone protein DnaK, Chaperone protein DnaJ 2 fusion [Thermus thermophilus]
MDDVIDADYKPADGSGGSGGSGGSQDLYATLDVPAPIAVVGGKVRAMTLEGPVEVAVPPRTQAGRKLRLKGKGFPGPAGRGDLYLEVRIT